MKPEASRRHRGVSIASPTNDPAAMAGQALHQSGTAGSPGGSRQWKGHGLATLATWAGVATAMIGGGHLVAWLTGWMAQRGVTDITMKTNAALCLLLSGVALVLLVPPEAACGATLGGAGLRSLGPSHRSPDAQRACHRLGPGH